MPDLDYNPRPIDLEDVELSTDLIELREAIAENAHEVWADQRQEEGWTYGPQRDDEKKETRTWCLIPCFLIRKKNMIDVWRLIRSADEKLGV